MSKNKTSAQGTPSHTQGTAQNNQTPREQVQHTFTTKEKNNNNKGPMDTNFPYNKRGETYSGFDAFD